MEKIQKQLSEQKREIIVFRWFCFGFLGFFFNVCYLSRHNDGETVGGPCHHRHFFIYPVQSGSLPNLLSESLRRASFSSSLV